MIHLVGIGEDNNGPDPCNLQVLCYDPLITTLGSRTNTMVSEADFIPGQVFG